MRNPDPSDGQRSSWTAGVSESSALRDRLVDDGRNGPDVPVYKRDLGTFIQGSNLLNSPVTADRNPGGAPHIALDPYK